MIKTICVSNQKGGSGKTTTAYNLSAALTLRGKKILIVDADGQANMTGAFGFNPDEIEKKNGSLFHLISDKKAKTRDFIIKTDVKNLELIPSCQMVFALEQELNMMTLREFRLNAALEPIRNDYDYIFIDTPPSLGHIAFNAFVASNAIIVVYNAPTFSRDGISQLVKTVYAIQEEKTLNVNNTEIIGCVWNNHDPRKRKINSVAEEDLKDVEALGKRFPTISEATVVVHSQEAHTPVNIFDPKHKVSRQYEQFADELLKLSKEV